MKAENALGSVVAQMVTIIFWWNCPLLFFHYSIILPALLVLCSFLVSQWCTGSTQVKYWKKRMIMFSQLKIILLYLCISCYFLQGLPVKGSHTGGNKMVGKNDLLNRALLLLKPA